MRFVLVLLAGLVACRGSSKQTPHGNEAEWKAIEALATTPSASGPPTDLERAIAIANPNGSVWREHVHDPAPTIAAFPQGADALLALKTWAAAKGALPPPRSPIQIGVVTLDMFSLGELAIATAKTADDLAPAEYLGTTLYTNGRSLL